MSQRSKQRPNERRQHQRVGIKQQIACRDADSVRKLYMSNLSLGGMFIHTPYPPPLGTIMRLGLSLPSPQAELELTAKVVQRQSFGVGVQFLDLTSTAMKSIETLIQSAVANPTPQLQGNLCALTDDNNLFSYQATPSLQKLSLPILLRYFYQQRASGTLHIDVDNHLHQIQLQHGVPVEITSSQFNENFCLGRLLKHASRISKAQLRQSLRDMESSGKKQGAVLLAAQAITWPELKKALEWQITLKLETLLSIDHGEYRWLEQAAGQSVNAADITPSIDLPATIFRCIMRQSRTHVDQCIDRLCNYEQHQVMPQPIKISTSHARPLFLSYDEITLWHHLVHRQPTVQTILPDLTADSTTALSMLLGLVAAGLVTLQRNASHDITSPLDTDNYFARLHLPWTCADKNKMAAAKTWVEAQYQTSQNPELQAKLEQAYNTLINDFHRRSHRRQLIEAQAIDRMAMRLHRYGKLRLKNGQHHEAVQLLQAANDLNPEITEYDRWLERAKQGLKSRRQAL